MTVAENMATGTEKNVEGGAQAGTVLDGVRAVVCGTIRIGADRLDIDAPFPELGIDSIIAMELMENLSRHFGITFTPAQFLNVNTVRELAAYLDGQAASQPVSQLVPQPASHTAPRPEAPAAPADPLAGLPGAVRSRFGIDLPDRRWDSIDEVVDELVSHNLDEVLRHLGTAGLADVPAPAAATRTGDVAIVGIACRFPDAPDADAFWRNLVAGRASIREIPKERWDWAPYYASVPEPGKTVSRWAAMIDGIDRFDAAFFGVDPREAALIDPQERLLMQEVYRALQDAAIDPRTLAGSNTGVFVGYEYAGYEQALRRNMDRLPGVVCSSASPTYYLANRLSYLFDLRGPSESVNVNCASSAVAINRACLALAQGESDVAIAGAACLHLSADDYVASTQYGLLSPDGSCGVFDNDANGFTRGEGVAAIVLKRLDTALADGDRVYAVIKACHQNNRGAAGSLSEVRHEAITDVVSRCHAKAGWTPDTVRYLELNGYAKKWADSFEFEGLRNVFGNAPSYAKTCALGSLKGNVGHLEPVNGIAAVIKVALALHHKAFPATITRKTPSSFIDLANTSHPLYFADAAIPFEAIRGAQGVPVRAGVSSFADSGVNVHIALEEFMGSAAASAPVPAPAAPELVVLSARDGARLAGCVDALAAWLDANQHTGLADVAHTLQVGRAAMDARLAIVAAGPGELREKLALVRERGIGKAARLDAHGVYCHVAGQAGQGTPVPLASLVTAPMARGQLELARADGQWQQVALLWVHGVDMPWHLAWTGRQAGKVSLPGYPFAPDRHWVELAEAAAQPLPAAALLPAPAGVVLPEAPFQADASAAPVDLLARFLREQVARLLGSTPEQVDPDAGFAALGLRSVAIAELVARVNRLLDVNLAPTVVFRHPDTAALAAHLARTFPEQVAALARPGAVADGAAIVTGILAPDILVPMCTEGAGTPLFLVPGADGSVLSLKALAGALGGRQPLFGLDAAGLDGRGPLPAGMDDVVAANLAALRRAQPRGPYRLLGYSNGGVVAFAMAGALLEQGEEVKELFLLDSLCPDRRTSTELALVVEVFRHVMATLGGDIDVDVAALAAVPAEERGAWLYDLMIRHGLVLERDYFLASYRVATASERVVRAYLPAPLPRPVAVHLVRATGAYPEAPTDYGWNRYLAAPLAAHDVAANHFTVIEAGAVPAVAAVIDGHAAAGTADTAAVEPAATEARPAARRGKGGGRRRGIAARPLETAS